jgi:hypothetical protein
MAYPQFSKLGLTTLVFTRQVQYPYSRPVEFQQTRKVSGGGVVRVARHGPRERFISLHLDKLIEDDYTALAAWLDDVEGASESFTYTDQAGTAHTVRLWQDSWDMPQGPGGFYSVTLLLRRED